MAEKQLRFVCHAGAGAVAPCANNCGFFGTAETKNLCSRCYRDHLDAVANAAEVERIQASLARRELGSCQDAAAAPAPATEKPAANSARHAGRRWAYWGSRAGAAARSARCTGTRTRTAAASTTRRPTASGSPSRTRSSFVVAPKIAKI